MSDQGTVDESDVRDGVSPVAPARQNPRWLVGLAIGLAAVLGVLLVVLVTGGDDDSAATGGCGEEAFMVLIREFGEGGNGQPTPMLAVEELLEQNPSVDGPGEWTNQGLASDPKHAPRRNEESEGALLMVRRDGSKATGEVIVVPSGGAGWNATTFTNCP